MHNEQRYKRQRIAGQVSLIGGGLIAGLALLAPGNIVGIVVVGLVFALAGGLVLWYTRR